MTQHKLKATRVLLRFLFASHLLRYQSGSMQGLQKRFIPSDIFDLCEQTALLTGHSGFFNSRPRTPGSARLNQTNVEFFPDTNNNHTTKNYLFKRNMIKTIYIKRRKLVIFSPLCATVAKQPELAYCERGRGDQKL